MATSSTDSDHEHKIYQNMANVNRYFRSFIKKGPVSDVLLWRNTRLSATILLGVTAIWSLFEVYEYNIVSLICHISMIAMLIIYITYTMAKYTQWDLPDFEEITIPESVFKWLYRKMNNLLLKFYHIASGEDLVLFLSTMALLWIISVVGDHFSSLNLIYLCFLCVGTLPALYERHQSEVDYLVSKGIRDLQILLRQFNSNILSKIPRGQVKENYKRK